MTKEYAIFIIRCLNVMHHGNLHHDNCDDKCEPNQRMQQMQRPINARSKN